MPTRRGNGWVYSSESGRTCPRCDHAKPGHRTNRDQVSCQIRNEIFCESSAHDPSSSCRIRSKAVRIARYPRCARTCSADVGTPARAAACATDIPAFLKICCFCVMVLRAQTRGQLTITSTHTFESCSTILLHNLFTQK